MISTDEIIAAELDTPLSDAWNRVPGVTVDGHQLSIDPDIYFFRYDSPRWVLCDWTAVKNGLLDVHEQLDTAMEQRTLQFVLDHGTATRDGGKVLRTAERVYRHLFREEHLADPGLAGLTPRHLQILREMGVMMSLNRVELSGRISTIGPAWFFPVCSQRVFDLDGSTAEQIDELYHGTFFNESRRVESVKAHAALGGRLVHGCQSAPDQSGGAVVAYGTDITAFSAELGRLKHEWMQRIRCW